MTTQASMRKTAGAGDRSEATRAAVKKYYIYVVLLVIVVIFSLVKVGEVGLFGRGAFLSPDSVINMLRVSAPILILSGAFTLLMISGYIDLSVGSAMSLAAVVFSLMILNGFAFLPAFAAHARSGDRDGRAQRLLRHEAPHHPRDRHPGDAEPLQGHRAADRA